MTWSARVTVSLLLYLASGACEVWADDTTGFKDQLAHAGITPSLVFDGDAAADLTGGVKRGATFSSILHAQLGLDLDKIAGLTGVTGWQDVLWVNGGQPGFFVGDAQGVSNIAAPAVLRLYQAWLQYNTPDNHFSIVVGRYDLNTEFEHIRSTGLFLNGSFGTTPEFARAGVGGPSIFPNTSLAVRLAYKPVSNAVLRFAVVDGAPVDPQAGSPGAFHASNGLLLVGEAAYVTRDPNDTDSAAFHIGRNSNAPAYDDKIAVGTWYFTGGFNDLSALGASGAPLRRQGEAGAYLLLDRLLYHPKNDPDLRVTGFLQLGIANQMVDRFGSYLGGGVTVTGLIPSRHDDQFGFAVAMARNGSHYLASQQQIGLPVTAAETAVELSYQRQVVAWLAVEPDVQYVFHPNTDPRRRDALVTQLHVEIRF